MNPLLPLFAAALLLSPAAHAQASAPAPSPQPEPPTVAVLALEANEGAEEAAPGIAALLASRLSEASEIQVLSPRDIEAALGTERHQQLLGTGTCSDGGCLEELARVLGARYMVTGRLDRLGDTYLLSVSLADALEGRGLARPSSEAANAHELLQVTQAIGEQLLAEIVPSAERTPSRPLLGSAREVPGDGLLLGLRINNTFINNLATLNPGADIELGYSFHPEWVAFLQVGLTFVRSGGDDPEGRLKVLPSVLGARHSYRIEHALRPYWGLGLGVQLSFGQFGIFRSTGPLPTIIGFGGIEYVIADSLGFQLEAGTNIAQAVLGLAEDGLGDGLNIDLAAGIVYHF